MTNTTFQPVQFEHATSFRAALGIQGRVIGALIIREIHTRFGRNNVGYLWMFIEPMLLSMGITAVHLAMHIHTSFGMEVAPFYLTGYTPFLMFRSIINRATATIESNRTLMYHRHVTIFNMLLARGLLDAGTTTFTLFVLLALTAAVGLGGLPDRPLLIFEGLALMFSFCFALSLPISAASEVSTAAEKIVHPITYLLMPLSGVFFVAESLPGNYRELVMWFPLMHVTTLIREGQFGTFDSQLVDIPYVVYWTGFIFLIGLLSIRVVRRHVVVG